MTTRRREGASRRNEAMAPRISSDTGDATRKRAYGSNSETDCEESCPISAPHEGDRAPISDSSCPPRVIQTDAMDWTSLPSKEPPAPTTSQTTLSYREGVDISSGFDDQSIRRIAKDYADFLLPRIQEMPTLAGVLYDLKVFYFQSMEERDMTLVRFELRVPGVEGEDRIALWREYSELIERVSHDFLEEVGVRTQKGLLFRRLRDILSEGVVSS